MHVFPELILGEVAEEVHTGILCRQLCNDRTTSGYTTRHNGTYEVKSSCIATVLNLSLTVHVLALRSTHSPRSLRPREGSATRYSSVTHLSWTLPTTVVKTRSGTRRSKRRVASSSHRDVELFAETITKTLVFAQRLNGWKKQSMLRSKLGLVDQLAASQSHRTISISLSMVCLLTVDNSRNNLARLIEPVWPLLLGSGR